MSADREAAVNALQERRKARGLADPTNLLRHIVQSTIAADPTSNVIALESDKKKEPT